jgi:hypothetical protein
VADEGRGGDGKRDRPRPTAVYSLLVGLVFIGIIAVASINTLRTEDSGVIGSHDEGDLPLAQFAVPDARSDLDGDANIAQDDCESSQIPCPESDRRTPACRVDVEGAIRVCDEFDRPLVISFWFTRGGDCERQQDAFETAYRHFSDRANFLAVDVRDDRDTVQRLIRDHGWTHPIGLDRDGALSNLYRVGGCPTFLYAFPGGILHATSLGQLDAAELEQKVNDLIEASAVRDRTNR